MEPTLFDRRSKALLDRFDHGQQRARRAERPFMVELLGTSNSGKTTLMDRLYTEFKGMGYQVAKVPEGAEVIPPPRMLPVYNLETGDYAVGRARRLAYDRNIHLAIFDRAIFDTAVWLEIYRTRGLISEEEHDAFSRTYLSRFNRELFDLHVFLVCGPEKALARKYGGEGYAAREARGEVAYGKTTNPAALAASLAAHETVWNRHGSDPRLFWVDTTELDAGGVAEHVFEACLQAFERRLMSP